MKHFFNSTLIAAMLAASLQSAAAEKIIVDTRKPGAEISPTMYGLFFEDINYAADGGLYAEMIKNRSFEFTDPLMGWDAFGKFEIKSDGPFERNPHYIRLEYPGHPHKRSGLQNEGFFGVSVKENENYQFSVWARCDDSRNSKIEVSLVKPDMDENFQAVAKATIEITSAEWTRYTVTLTPSMNVSDGLLRIMLRSENPVELEHISLFPEDTWQNRPGGLRRDLAEKLDSLHPGIFRFPGGCIVEGTDLDSRYQWKNSVGQVENRPVNENRWHYTFDHRYFPDYFQSYGLGFFEFFQLSEDIGAEPLPVLSVGLACQFQNSDESAHVSPDSLKPYIDDALDLIEFANGPVTSTWGKLRAEMGHPEPFGLKYIGIGNEQWDEPYVIRLRQFVDAIRSRYPDIKIVGSSGPSPEGKRFDYLWPQMKELKVDLVDEHFYSPESWFLAQGTRYDGYDRKGPKVFAGEYACHGKGKKFNHFNAALLEAAFMTGLERNADIVEMATYAPLFAHVKGWQWRPDLIWFDNEKSVATSSYHVQKMYADNRGTNVLQTTMAGHPVAGLEGQNGIFSSAVTDKRTGQYIIKVVNTSSEPQPLEIELKGLPKGTHQVKAITLQSSDPDADNTIDNPYLITPAESQFAFENQLLSTTIPASTFTVYIVQ